ncbi:GNAT family N-acetyltransferase [Glycomyces rhizosphaerae]|uniref:GNAT family N-acetyltransferase n=1 Tax=Glycomyces rhizosphaerae TaxID=2054422 RepID=A0ABV7PW11_9ACTN
MIELRALSSEDWRLWRELRLAALAEAPYAFASRLADWQGDGDREERWRSRLAMPGSHNLVAEVDGRPVGMASGVPTGDAMTRELIAMWVSPKARGAGVGDALILGVARWARTSGAAQLRLAVYERNAAAKGLYKRNGFIDLAAPSDPDLGADRVMMKPLDDRI